MFISKKKVKSIEKRIDDCVSESRFDMYVDRIRELEWRMESLEKLLLVTYEVKPVMRVHCRKGGPEQVSS